ncbi:MAG: 6-pyruvoyltetrahydropterin/6-carboxytetrahydropterin synthase [Saprospiraceae bacterium]|jgi:6-pyruvoyltetrahydropterin/6-carboxytetrahydropterin synthase
MQKCYTVVNAPFEAACKIDSMAADAPASRLHGHSYLARIRAELPQSWGQFVGSEVDELHQQLLATVAPLDHRYLNDIINNPTNENIVRWLNGQLGDLSLEKTGVQSTSHEGVDLDSAGRTHSWKRFRFEAAHQLPNVEPGHQCGRMHGHGFEVILHAHQQLEDAAMGVNLDTLQLHWSRIEPLLNRTCLNNIAGLENPTSEHLCRWIWEQLKSALNELSWVSVYETATAGSHYDGKNFRIWKEFNFDSATHLADAPQDHLLAGLHGHSYLARLHIQAPLDEVLGWTVDYGDVKKLFKPTLDQLDHHDLSINGQIPDGSTRAIAQYIKQEIVTELPQLNRIDLYEQPGCGVVLSWSDESPALPV